MADLPPFHIAFPVNDLAAARAFYGGILGCEEGRSDEKWVDFNLFGHQIVAHLVENSADAGKNFNHVDRHEIPVPHFGVVLDWDAWTNLAEQLRLKQVEFSIEPCIRFAGQPGEQATMFLLDPAGNALEFKAFRDKQQIFSK
jgi:extradiol dioxygenase family protein